MRTLIIDDSAVMRKVIERSLRLAGFDISELYEAGNGAEALDVLQRTHPFDLILSDINMPAMDGLEFLEQCRLQNLAPGVPIVMITTEASEALVLRAMGAGASGYISKPFTPDQVKARVGPLVIARS